MASIHKVMREGNNKSMEGQQPVPTSGEADASSETVYSILVQNPRHQRAATDST